MNVRRILCPTDFSEPSTHALEQATRLAGSYGARLTVLHVRPTVTPHPDMPDGGPVAPWLMAELDELRQRVTASCAEVTGSAVALEPMVAAGDPVREIVRYTTTLPADLVVMGTHGVSGFRHLVLGSITEKVLRTAPCPVLTVPPRTQTTASQFTRVLCAVDFSDCSLAAVNRAASLAAVSGATLTLLHVLEWPWHDTAAAALEGVSPLQGQAITDYRRYLERGAKERLDAVAASALPTSTVATVVRFGKPYVELLDAARQTRADLIVLGVRGRGAVDLAFFGSTANHVVRSASSPVLTVRA
jgi:nucleotide-binding universal stress UspA family protein